jgi:hypothetical protein
MMSFANTVKISSSPKAFVCGASSVRAIIDGIIIRVHIALGLILLGEKYNYTAIRGV